MAYWPGTNIRKSTNNDFNWWGMPCKLDWRTPQNQFTKNPSTAYVPLGTVISTNSPVPPEANLRRIKK